MSIADQITRLNNAKAAIKQSIENKGVTVSDKALLDEYPALIDSIPMEGGDPRYEDFYNLRTNNGTSMKALFAYSNVPELDLRSLDVSKVTDMSRMFDNCSSSVNIDGWDTSSLENTSQMFYAFTGSIDISKLNTSKITNVEKMFYYANVDKIILTGLSFPNATSLKEMFTSIRGTRIDLSSWDISNITNMYYLFSDTNLKIIDLTGWKTTNVTNMSNMFYKYESPLEELIIPDWDMTNVTESSTFMSPNYMKKLKLIDLSRSNDLTIKKVAGYLPTRTDTTFGKVLVPENTSQDAFDTLIAKYWAPIGAAITPIPTNINIVSELDEIKPGERTKIHFGACDPWNADTNKTELVSLNDLATIDEDNVITSTGAIGNIEIAARAIDTQEIIGTKTIAVSETDSYPNLVKWRIASTPASYMQMLFVNGKSKKITDVTYDSISDIYSYDAGEPITSIRFESGVYPYEVVKINTSNLTSLLGMFYSCKEFITLDLTDWDISNAKSMNTMFQYCYGLTTLDLSSWDIGHMTDLTGVFSGCSALTNFKAPKNISVDLNLSECPLTHESLMSVINNLAEVTKTRKLTLGGENLAKLTDEEKAIATGKGWTLSY